MEFQVFQDFQEAGTGLLSGGGVQALLGSDGRRCGGKQAVAGWANSGRQDVEQKLSLWILLEL